jgi:lipopolysaccharide biosynthesis glycosyltransferase
MNLEKLRENAMLSNIIQWLQGHMHSVLYADQDGFDALLAHDCTWLEDKFNAIKGTTKNPTIMHYAGTNRKPWLKRGSLISSRSMISSFPYVMFRQETPMKKPWHEVLGLLFCQ